MAIGTTDRLVSVVDLFATIAGLTGAPLPAVELDSVDFGPILLDPDTEDGRGLVYSETYEPNGAPFPYDTLQMSARDERYKLMVVDGTLRFHDLESDPYELDALDLGSLTDDERAATDRAEGLHDLQERVGGRELLKLRSTAAAGAHGGGTGAAVTVPSRDAAATLPAHEDRP